MEGIVKRLKEFIDYKRLNSLTFSQELGYNNSEKISRLFRNEGAKPSCDIIEDISNKFEELNIDWWITGKGRMLKSQTTKNTFTSNKKILSTGNVINIPITDISVAAGDGAINSDYIDITDTIQLPQNLIKKGTHLCVRIKGASMSPTLQDGGYMIIRNLDRSEWDKQPDERIYAVTTNDATAYLKRLKLRFKEGFVVCMSDSPDKSTYPNFNLTLDEINTLWYAEWYLSAKMPNIHDQYYNRLQRLEDDMDELKGILKRIK